MNGRLQDRVCVVTGAARGIGLAIAERFGREGARVACVDVSARRLEPTVAELVSRSVDARAFAVDVGRRDEVHEMFHSIESEFAAPVAVLVNNAVWARFQPLDEIDRETVDRMFACGVEGLIWTTRCANRPPNPCSASSSRCSDSVNFHCAGWIKFAANGVW